MTNLENFAELCFSFSQNIANTYSEDFDVPSVSLSSLAERETTCMQRSHRQQRLWEDNSA